MEICVVLDEISGDPETALELASGWGLHHFELRGYGTDRVPCFSAFQKQRLAQLLAEYEAEIVAISPGIFKCPFPRPAQGTTSVPCIDYASFQDRLKAFQLLRYHREELLPRSIEYALEIGAGMIVIFGFLRGQDPMGQMPDEALEALHDAGDQAAGAGLTLALEVEKGLWADTGEHTAEILRALNHPAIGANWDPGNAFVTGETPYPNGYEHLKTDIRHVHFKDALRDRDGTCRYVTQGEIDWSGQIAALANDGYKGYISIEHHMRPKVKASDQAARRLRRLIALASSGQAA